MIFVGFVFGLVGFAPQKDLYCLVWNWNILSLGAFNARNFVRCRVLIPLPILAVVYWYFSNIVCANKYQYRCLKAF